MSILHYAFLAVTVLCVLSPLTFGSLHRWCCGPDPSNNALDVQSMGLTAGASIGGATLTHRGSSVFTSSNRHVLFVRYTSSGSSPITCFRGTPSSCHTGMTSGSSSNFSRHHRQKLRPEKDASASISPSLNVGMREGRSVSVGASCALFRPRRQLTFNLQASDLTLTAEPPTPTPTPARSPTETSHGTSWMEWDELFVKGMMNIF